MFFIRALGFSRVTDSFVATQFHCSAACRRKNGFRLSARTGFCFQVRVAVGRSPQGFSEHLDENKRTPCVASTFQAKTLATTGEKGEILA